MRVTYDPLRPYVVGERSAARINAIMDSIEAAGASLDAVNFREEAFDASRFTADGTPVNVETGIDSSTRTVLAATGVFAQLVVGGSNMRTGGVSIAANERLRIRVRVQLESSVSSGLGLASGGLLAIRISKTVSGVTSALTGSRRRQSRGIELIQHGVLRSLATIDGPASIDDIRIEYTLSVAADCHVGTASIVMKRFKRVTL